MIQRCLPVDDLGHNGYHACVVGNPHKLSPSRLRRNRNLIACTYARSGSSISPLGALGTELHGLPRVSILVRSRTPFPIDNPASNPTDQRAHNGNRYRPSPRIFHRALPAAALTARDHDTANADRGVVFAVAHKRREYHRRDRCYRAQQCQPLHCVLPQTRAHHTLQPPRSASRGRAPRSLPVSSFRLTSQVLPPAHLNHGRVIRCANYLRPRADRPPKATDHPDGPATKRSETGMSSLSSPRLSGLKTLHRTLLPRLAAACVRQSDISADSAIGRAMRSPRSSKKSCGDMGCGTSASLAGRNEPPAREGRRVRVHPLTVGFG